MGEKMRPGRFMSQLGKHLAPPENEDLYLYSPECEYLSNSAGAAGKSMALN